MGAKQKDLITKAELAAFIKQYKAERGYDKKKSINPLALQTRSLLGDVKLDMNKTGGSKRYTAGKGMKEHELKDPQTKKYLESTRKADYESKRLGEERKHGKSIFNRVIDVLSRGNYASAEAFRRAGTLEDDKFWDFGAGAEGFVQGLTGKKKTTFSDVLKEHDNLSGWKRGAVGLGLDIFADPLTYTGVGLVSKVAGKSGKVVESLDKAADIETKLVSKGASSDQVREAINAAAIPVQNLKKRHIAKLSPEAKKVYEYAVDARGANPSNVVDKVVTGFKRKINNASHIDLRMFKDEDLVKVATETVRGEEKAYPGLTAILRRVRATKSTPSPADSYASYVRFKQGQIQGNIRINPYWLGNRESADNYAKATADMVSVVTNNADEAVKYVTLHEIGHQMAQAMSQETKKLLHEKMFKTYAKPRKMSKQEFVHHFDELEQRVLAAEKSHITEPLTAVQKAAQKQSEETGDWKLFSKKRGYTDEQMADYEKYLSYLNDPKLDFDELGWTTRPYPKGSANFGSEAQSIAKVGKLYDRLIDLGKTPSADPDWSEALSKYSTKPYPDEIAEGMPGIEEMTAEAWAEFRMLGDKARPMAKEVAAELIKHAPKVPSKAETSAILKQLADDFVEADVKSIDEWVDRQMVKKYGDDWGYEKVARDEASILRADQLAKAGHGDDLKSAKEAIEEELLAATARNLNPGVKKQFQLKLGPTAVGIPKAYEAVHKANQAIASLPGIKQSVDKFNEMFRVSAYLPKGLDHLRAKGQGQGLLIVTQHVKLLQSIFDPVPRQARQGVLKALRDGADSGTVIQGGKGLDGLPVGNLAEYVKTEMRNLDISRIGADISLEEINSFLDPKFWVKANETKTTVQKIADVDQYGMPVMRDKIISQKSLNSDAMYEAILRNDSIKDPAQALYLYGAALNQAIAKRNMWTTVAQTHGVPKSALTEKLVREYGWRQVKVNKATDEFYFSPEVANGIERMNHVFRDKRSTGQFIDQYDKALQGFKSVVTRYNPSFHSRTFFGEMLLGYMGGMKNMRRSYGDAFKVLRGRNEQFMGQPLNAAEFGQGASKGLIQASNVLRGQTLATTQAPLVDGSKVVIKHAKFGNLTADKLWHHYLETGLKSGYAATDLVRGADATIGRGGITSARNVMQTVTESVEDTGRLAHFIDVLRHTKAKTFDEAVEEAAATVRKYHLDYTAVTVTEKNIMTRAIPFYKWIRLSTPLMAEILLTSPGKALMVPKTLRAISEMAGYDTDQFGAFPGGPDAVVPEWLRDHGAAPWAEIAGNTNYLDPTAIFPLAGSADLAQEGGLKALSPFFKWGADLYAGQDKFGNQLTGEGATAKDRLHYAAMQTPQTAFAEQMITKRDPGIPRWQSLAQFLANPGNQPNTEKRMRGEAFRDRQEAYSHRKQVKKDKGVQP